MSVVKLVFDSEKIKHEDELVAEIKALVYSFAGKITVAAALGCMDIAKFQVENDLLGERE